MSKSLSLRPHCVRGLGNTKMIELIYTLFLFSGLFKTFFISYAPAFMAVDFTLLCALILTGAYTLRFSRDFFFESKFFLVDSSKSIVFTLLLFFLWMNVTLLYTRSPGYCYTKIFMFLTVFVALAFPLVYRGFNPRRFSHLFAYLGSGLVFVYTALLPNVYSTYLRSAEFREMVVKYLDIGFLAGAIILVLAFACPRMNRFVKVLLMVINIWTLILSAARGPMVFLSLVLLIRFAVSFVAFMRKSWTLNLKNVFYIAMGLGFFGAAVYYLTDKYALLVERSIYRILQLIDPEVSTGIMMRISQIGYSLDKIFENTANFLLGLGIGSFGILYEGVDKRMYPHNMVLEIWFEMGFIGALLLMVLLFLYFKKIRCNFNFVLILAYLLLNSLKSYSIIDLRVMFGLFSVLLVYVAQSPRGPGNSSELKK